VIKSHGLLLRKGRVWRVWRVGRILERGRTLKSFGEFWRDRNMERNMERDMERDMERNMERDMERLRRKSDLFFI